MQAASHQQFTGIYHAISAKVTHWAARGLFYLFIFIFGRERYSLHEATITTSKEHDVHCIP